MSLSFLLENPDEISLTAFRSVKLKKSIIKRLTFQGESTISQLSRETNLSIPTVTKAISELLEEDALFEVGRHGTKGGRKPKKFGLNPASCYYLGVEVNRKSVSIGIQDFKNNFVKLSENLPYTLENTIDSLYLLCSVINKFVDTSGISRAKIIGACVNLSGRINSRKGFSYSYFFFEEKPLSEIIESQIHLKTFLENDTRAMAYGEYNSGVANHEKNVIFVNISWGVGIGIICNGTLLYGRSGYSGEFGHSPVYDNEIMCQCGKKGCLETEISAAALERKFRDALKNGSRSILSGVKPVEEVTLDDILNAVKAEDTLAIEIVEEIGNQMGRYLSMLVNIFNPELVIIGGMLAETGIYIQLPIKTALQKYSLSLVNQDMKLKMSALGSKAGVAGACFILRDKLFSGI